MSTLSIAPAFRSHTLAPAPRPVTAVPDAYAAVPVLVQAPVRLTRRGRLVVVGALLGLALVLMTVLGGWAAATRHAGPPASVSVVTVAPGDTLYGIAGRIAEPGHVRDMVVRIQQLNSLSGATLQPGQHLAVPRG